MRAGHAAAWACFPADDFGNYGSLFPGSGTLAGLDEVTYHADVGVEGGDWIRSR